MPPSRPPLLLSRPIVVLGLVIGFLLAAGTALLSTFSTRNIANAGARAADTQANVLAINQLLGSLIDAETGQRGYMLTGSESYLEPYTQAIAVLGDQLAALRHRFRHSPAQLADLGKIEELVAAKQAELRQTIELRRNSQTRPALRIVDSGTGLQLMNALRETVGRLEQRELAALAEHSAAVGRRAAFFQHIGWAVLIVTCVLAGAGGVVVLRRLHELEDLITVCAWTKRVKFNGGWVSFEEYLRARFNLKFTHGISEDAARQLEHETDRPTTPEPAGTKPRTTRFTPPYPTSDVPRHPTPRAA